MATGSPNFDRRQKALEAVRRHVRRLEIETHRVKAHLARLEAEYEEDLADWMTRTLRRRRRVGQRFDEPHAAGFHKPDGQPPSATLPPVNPAQAPTRRSNTELPGAAGTIAHESPPEGEESRPFPQVDVGSVGTAGALPTSSQLSPTYRRTAQPILLSFAVHAVGLALCTMFGFATLAQQNPQLFASPSELLADSPEEFNDVAVESAALNDTELQSVLSESDQFHIADSALREFEPAQLGAGAEVAAATEFGQLDALPNELGTLIAGDGAPGSGPPGGKLGDAAFFGTRAQGNRFVFVVDNSSSMKGGRLETAIAELVRSVDALSPRQAFYVIFVSDQTYPMFYPQPAAQLLPATTPNKKRLAEWLPKAMLASGRNRELIKAMDLAASLQPHAVYLLWDGDLRYSERVRLEVMTHLTRPNQWNFAIHTLGMGVSSLDAEYNLTAIAKAHGGTYRRVDVPPTRSR